MADQELVEVKEELEEIGQQLEDLLQRQEQLIKRKEQLENSLSTVDLTNGVADEKHDWESSDFSWSKDLDRSRSGIFGISKFRPLQRQTMNATLSGKHCILIMPTGGGKSLCFQLPAVISKGITLVVSPLVSLMEDQVMSLQERKVEAVKMNADISKDEVNNIQAAMVDLDASLKMIYVTPEKLAKSKRFMAKLEKCYAIGKLERIVIDEIHCCSQWGHDFRTDYKFLGVLHRMFPKTPILGLTATATDSVINDVKSILGIPKCILFRASFNRTNLYYEVIEKEKKGADAIEQLSKIIKSRFLKQSGIVYCFSRKDSETVAEGLLKLGISAACYHADMNSKDRSRIHKEWIKNNVHVIVATVAFGMGIDKPDVRYVIHHSMSKSMENYYQESGRAGRDDKPSHCILMASFSDIFRQSTMVFTEQTGLKKLYDMVEYSFDAHRCRRTLIARHFGERWDSSKCRKMCDHCDSKSKGESSVEKKDLTRESTDILKYLRHAAETQQRITSLKLTECCLGKGGGKMRVASVAPSKLSRESWERLIAHMLVHGWLKEDFHFTPYSTISYAVPGSRAKLLESGKVNMELDFVSNTKLNKSSTNAAKKVSQKNGSSSKSKVKVSVINPEKSAFRKSLGEQKATPSTSTSSSSSSKEVKKRQRQRLSLFDGLSDDEEFSDLDFGDSDVDFVPKSLSSVKKKKLSL